MQAVGGKHLTKAQKGAKIRQKQACDPVWKA